MNDYMRALHQRFFQKPLCAEQQREIQLARLELRNRLDKPERRTLLRLLNAEALMREKISLASFTAGFKLAAGIAKELEADGIYSFDEEETEQLSRLWKKEV